MANAVNSADLGFIWLPTDRVLAPVWAGDPSAVQAEGNPTLTTFEVAGTSDGHSYGSSAKPL